MYLMDGEMGFWHSPEWDLGPNLQVSLVKMVMAVG